MAGNGPVLTNPIYCTDEDIVCYARGDWWALAPQWTQIAYGQDGSFSSSAPWVLNSASVNFGNQGVVAQQVIALSGPKPYGNSLPQLFAVDSASGTSVTLRRVGGALNFGQPPAPSTGLAGVTFEIRTWASFIEVVSYRIKKRLGIDEMIPFRTSEWMYQGVEDQYRAVRDAVAWGAIADAYQQETRDLNNFGDFARKAKWARERYEEAISHIEVRWGSFGTSSPSTNITTAKLSR